jgi:Tfp pilus assembly protein PilW
MISDRKKTQGFTIIEAIVATAVFAFFIVSLLGVYLSILRLDSRTRGQRAVTDNTRFIMEYLSKEVRDGRIDYTAVDCGGTVTSTADLCLINQNGESEHIYAQNPVGLISGDGTNLILSKNGTATSLNSASVKITKLEFLVSPSTDSLTQNSISNGVNEQPHVTVVMEVTLNSVRDPVKLNVQSTFTENYYPSRQ